MATEAQILANLANARLSTGPKTAEGKARSAENSLRHGFRSAAVLLPGDDPVAYDALLAQLESHFAPEDLTEERAVREMAAAEWRLRRVRSQLAALVSGKIAELESSHPGAGPEHLQFLAFKALHEEPSPYPAFARYEAGFERQYQRAYTGWQAYQEKKTLQRRRHDQADLENFLVSRLPQQPQPDEANSPPPPQENQPDEANSAPPAAPPIPRNAPCPCGSGEKYKRCHGRNAPPVLSLSPVGS